MGVITWNEIVKKAREFKTGVEKKYTLVDDKRWAYYFAKATIQRNADVKKISFAKESAFEGDYFSRQLKKSEYMDMAQRLVAYVEKNKQLPNNILINGKKMKVRDYLYMFARVIVYYVDNNKTMPKKVNVNSKAFTKPIESLNVVYDYFVKVFGRITCIDDALDKIDGNGYRYYYDDRYSNKESIDRMKNGYGVNCTDSCQVFYNLGLAFIKKGVYKKVECLHIKCRGGDGHVRLRFTLPNGDVFYRDPACTLSDGGYCNWCSDGTLLAVNPNWFMENLNR